MKTLTHGPNWETAARIYTANVEHGENGSVKHNSRVELARCGALADCWNYLLNNHKEAIKEILKTDKTLSAMYKSAKEDIQ